ncbi:unnamed protein product [Linum tenue]|uniref:Borealin C-terminal domain-containing protein n=1 Tax=Linum tenue TaxID=586396 RepID=A0AAV0PYH6_9ROSI|nr:unnamed protein product [Linum tenue]
MPKRKAKRNVKKAVPPPQEPDGGNESALPRAEERKPESSIILEVERQVAAIRAIRDMEIEHSLTALRLLRSNFTEEQLDTPVLEIFKENFPNLSIVKSSEAGQFELQWKDKGDDSSLPQVAGGEDVHDSLLRGLSMAYPSCSDVPSLGAFELPSHTVTKSVFGNDSMQMDDFILEGQSNFNMLSMQDGLQTPGATSQRLSVGMTPKTLRLPKHGEMLLSVRGSPLGVYKEDNMEAIRGIQNLKRTELLLQVYFDVWS